MNRFGFVDHPPSVTLVVVDGDELVLVRQPRPGSPGATTLELPAGSCEPGETPSEAAARELAEECGLAAATLTPIGGFLVVPSYSSEFTHVFEARHLSPADARPDDDEEIAVERRPIADALSALSDAGSIAALALWLEQR